MKSKTVVETDELQAISTLPEAKLKPMLEAAQKAMAVAKLAMKYTKEDAPFNGKLTLYVFTDYTDLKDFIRKIETRRPVANTPVTSALRGDGPYVALSPDAGAKLNEADLALAIASRTAAAVLNKRIGTDAEKFLPDWLQSGFGRTCLMRSGKNDAALAMFRSKQKAVVLATGTNAITMNQVWEATIKKDTDAVAASAVEYLAFGPPAEKFQPFCKALKNLDVLEEKGLAPDQAVVSALATVEWTIEGLDYGWKEWVKKGKFEAK
jgi:hypothetical protein